jgi:hypothetical protein
VSTSLDAEEQSVTEASDRNATMTAVAGVAVVALTAAVISFSHVRQLALDAGESELASWLLPVSIDGAIAAAVAVILADSRAGRRPAGLTWTLLALGLSGSLAAYIASAEATVVAGAVAAWPPIGLALGIEVLAGLMRRHERQHEPVSNREAHQPAPVTRPSATRQGLPVESPSAPALSSNGSRPTGSSGGDAAEVGSARKVPIGSRPAASGRRPSLDDAEAVAMIRQLDAGAPGGMASRMEIQKRLGCGGSRAARLADLARQSVTVPSS